MVQNQKKQPKQTYNWRKQTMAANIWNVKIKEMLAFGDDETINTVYYHINVDLLNSDHAWRIFTDEDMGKVPVLDYPSTHTLLKELQKIPSCIILIMRVALVHDYINDFGGAERVLLALSEIYPKAPIYTLYAKKNSAAYKRFKNRHIIESWFANLPFPDKLISPFRFLIPMLWSKFDFSKFDFVITSSSWAITKGIKKGKNTTEICYLHTPPRYLYGFDSSRRYKNKYFQKLLKAYSLIVNHFMRLYDFEHAQKVDYFIVNSKNVQLRCQKYYRRDSTIIYPPVDTNVSKDNSKLNLLIDLPKKYYLAGGRLVAAKNFDLIIKTMNKLYLPLLIYGSGSEEKHLRKIAGPTITFLGNINDHDLHYLYKNAICFVVAQRDEDFGITPIEANAEGTPVIAFHDGGYLETVIEGKTGIFFDELTSKSLAKAIKKLEKNKFNPTTLQNHAQKFSKKRFQQQIQKFIKSKLQI